VFQAQFQRRREGRQMIITRGGIALNEPVRLAEKGVLVAARADRLDADGWRKALAGKPASGRAAAARARRVPPLRPGLRAASSRFSASASTT
jgi:uncharacterized protein YhdP